MDSRAFLSVFAAVLEWIRRQVALCFAPAAFCYPALPRLQLSVTVFRGPRDTLFRFFSPPTTTVRAVAWFWGTCSYCCSPSRRSHIFAASSKFSFFAVRLFRNRKATLLSFHFLSIWRCTGGSPPDSLIPKCYTMGLLFLCHFPPLCLGTSSILRTRGGNFRLRAMALALRLSSTPAPFRF